MSLRIEIWRVPQNWSHPVDEKGRSVPLFGQDYDVVARRWARKMSIWPACRTQADPVYFWELIAPPKREHYIPLESGNSDAYQIYDDWGVGLPQSPVFPDLEDMKNWLVEECHFSKDFAKAFSRYGYPKRSQVKDGSGYFRILHESWFRSNFEVEFVINGFRGYAALANHPVGMNYSRVFSLHVQNPTADPSSSALYSYPKESAGQKKPTFIDSLVTLLDNVYQTPEENLKPWLAWSMNQD